MNKLNILYEDNHVIVVEKPCNILSQEDITGNLDMLTMIKEYIKEKYNKPGNVYLGLVHRLDRPVGGIMVFAKTSKAASRLSEQVRNHTLKKKYIAVVRGILKEDSGEMIDYLKKCSNGNTVVTNENDGKYSKLTYKVLEKNIKENMTLVQINLETGRHHQIRVQFASRGYFLCGDQRYGVEDRTQIALYAAGLEFIHPTTKEVMKFTLWPSNGIYWTKFTVSNIVKNN